MHRRFHRDGMLVAALVLGLAPVGLAGAAMEDSPQATSPPLLEAGVAPVPTAAATVYASRVEFPLASTDPARSRTEIDAWHYNNSYLFGLSRRVASGGAIDAVKPILFLVTFPLDVVLLPIAFIGGFFG